MSINPIPAGYQQVIPYLIVNEASKLLEFIEQVFGGKIIELMKRPDGVIMHAEAKVGDSVVMIAEAQEAYPAIASVVYVYIANVDAVYAQAIAAGATSIMAPADQFYGDRNCGVKDPTGITWWIGSHVEDVSPEELAKRQAALGK